MLALTVLLRWRRSAGVELLPVIPDRPDPSATLIGAGGLGRPERIVCIPGEVYRPLEADKKLFKKFADIRQSKDLINFGKRYGALTSNGFNPEIGDGVDLLLHQAEQMRLILYRPQGINATRTVQNLARLDASLYADPLTGAPILEVSPPTLLSGLWLQLAQWTTGGTEYSVCPECQQPFEAGPGTRLRLRSKFCSEAHRIAFNNSKRSLVRTK